MINNELNINKKSEDLNNARIKIAIAQGSKIMRFPLSRALMKPAEPISSDIHKAESKLPNIFFIKIGINMKFNMSERIRNEFVIS
jgi:hypothetical protein